MTFACSRRSLVATALAAGLVLPVAASAAGNGPGGHHTPTPGSTPTPGGHGSPSTSRHQVSGILNPNTVVGTTGTTRPAALTVKSGDTTVTVIVSAKTQFVRGHGGRSSPSELTPGDRIAADGSFETGSSTTFDARRIRDLSIAYVNVVGSVAHVDVGRDGVVTLLPARRGSPHSPYWRGEVVSVTLSPSTKVISGSVNLTQRVPSWQSAVNWMQTPPLHVRVTGLYDTANHALPTLRADTVRILGTPSQPHEAATGTAEPGRQHASATQTAEPGQPHEAATGTAEPGRRHPSATPTR